MVEHHSMIFVIFDIKIEPIKKCVNLKLYKFHADYTNELCERPSLLVVIF